MATWFARRLERPNEQSLFLFGALNIGKSTLARCFGKTSWLENMVAVLIVGPDG